MKKQIQEIKKSARFYRLIQEVTTELVGAKGEDIDTALHNCLKIAGEYFGVDSVSLGGISKTGELMPTLYLWGQLPPKKMMLASKPTPGPEMATQFNRDGYFIYNRLEDLNELPQYQEHTRRMGVPAAAFWKHHDQGSWIEGMAFSSKKPKTWPDGIVEHIGALGVVLFNALYRKRAEEEAERLRQFEQIVAATASEFVHLSPERVDAEIEKTLERICKCVNADLSSFLQWRGPEKLTLEVSHEWYADFVDGPHFRGSILADEYPWLTARLRESKPVLIHSLDNFPPEAFAERTTCERIGIRSILWAPFVAAHGLQGYIALSTINRPGAWLESVIPQLGLVGNVLASAVERQQADFKLLQAYDEIRQLKDYVEAENVTLREEIKASFEEDELVGKSHAFQTVIHQVQQVAKTDSTVLLLGKTGTGKGLIARLLHRQSRRKDRPLVTVNCAALPAELIESELFGHEKGAFTGAVARKIGRFELADGATIFLDEIGDLPIQLQAKLLRVLQEREFERLGSSTTRNVDTRVIAATNRNLDLLIEQGMFRDDLYYRLGVFPIRLPSLRERRTDIPLLAWFFITELQGPLGKTIEKIPPGVMKTLTNHDWPGNVRELRNVIERAMILTPGTTLDLESVFPCYPRQKYVSSPISKQQSENLEDVERTHIVKVLEKCNWKVRGIDGAAERLGLKRTTLQSRMKRLGIQRPSA
ncbi:MAG: sigma 54-interacting transcriptional regulator [Rhodothermales bacterium]